MNAAPKKLALAAEPKSVGQAARYFRLDIPPQSQYGIRQVQGVRAMNRVVERLPLLRRAILHEHRFSVALLWSLIAVTLPLLLRLAIDGGRAGVPFATFFPSVMLASLLLGWRWGTVVMLACAVVTNRLLMHEPLDPLVPVDFLLAGIFLFSGAMLVVTADLARKLVQEMDAAKAREETLKFELLHRIKNMLALVSAMEWMTARYSAPGEYREALTSRLQALQRATTMLGATPTEPCCLEELLERSLAPFRTPENMVLEGRPCRVAGEACLPLVLALHELCTNAVKHGALGAPEGRVRIWWEYDEPSGTVVLNWTEQGGPAVKPPTREGMGTQLLRRQRDLGEVRIDFAPDGLTCQMRLKRAATAQT